MRRVISFLAFILWLTFTSIMIISVIGLVVICAEEEWMKLGKELVKSITAE